MRFEKCDNNPMMKRSELSEYLSMFESLNIPYAEAKDWEKNYKDAYCLSGVINTWAKRNNKPQIKAHVVKKRVYIVNTILANDKEK